MLVQHAVSARAFLARYFFARLWEFEYNCRVVFSSNLFLLYFLPAFLLVYHLVGARFRNYVMLGASIVFYSWGAPKFVFVILGSTLLDFYIVRSLHRSRSVRRRKLLLAASVCVNLGLLAYFKYANFFVENLNAALEALGFNEVGWTAVALPIGISFYTFQTLTYSVDVYRKVHAPLDKATDYLLYIMSFPQMIAGPIVRFGAIAEQITARKEVIDDKLIGFYRFCVGLGKKVLIANVMARQADAVFDGDLSQLSAGEAWLGVLAYTFQIYFDFSGYSDMAIGLGRMTGFRFPENFDSPYVAQSITEFWRRWHVTLGAFMRDYLYIPLGGNRVARWRLYFNLWIVFLLSGLWHGAAWNFVIWGGYHGLFLIIDRLFLLNLLRRAGKFPSILLTFFLVMLGWVVFRLESLREIRVFLGRLFSFDSASLPDASPEFVLIASLAGLFSFLTAFKFGKSVETFVFFKERYAPGQHFAMAAGALALLVLSISSITSSDLNPFIYFRF